MDKTTGQLLKHTATPQANIISAKAEAKGKNRKAHAKIYARGCQAIASNRSTDQRDKIGAAVVDVQARFLYVCNNCLAFAWPKVIISRLVCDCESGMIGQVLNKWTADSDAKRDNKDLTAATVASRKSKVRC